MLFRTLTIFLFLTFHTPLLRAEEMSAYDAVLKRGQLVVNVVLQAIDLAFFPASGAPPSGFFVDIFRVIATAIFGDSSKISFYRGVAETQEMTSLLIENHVDMALYHDYRFRDGFCGSQTCQSAPFFYTSQGFLLENNPFLTQLEDLPTLTACIVDKQLPKEDLKLIQSTGLSVLPRVFSTYEEATSTFLENGCEALWLPAHMAGSFLKTLLPSVRSQFQFLNLPIPVTYSLFLPPGRLFTVASQALGVLIAADEQGISPEDLHSPLKKEAWHTFLKEQGLSFPLEYADKIIKEFGSYKTLFSKYFGDYHSFGISLKDNITLKAHGGMLSSKKLFESAKNPAPAPAGTDSV